jgi:hypothetical protein
LLHSDYFKTENDRFNYRVSSKKDLEEMKIMEKFYLNNADINDTSALYLVKWKNKDFTKYTLVNSFLIDNIVYFREEKLNDFDNYKYYITDFNPSINLSNTSLLTDSSIQFTNQIITKEIFFDMFSKGDVFVPFKGNEDYYKFRDFITEMIVNIRRKVNLFLIKEKIKVLICYDHNEKYKNYKWKLQALDKTIITSRFKEDQHICMRILSEMINLHKVKIKKNLFPYFYLKENNIDKLFEDIEFDNRYVCYDILFTHIDNLREFTPLFNTLDFNLVIYDVDKTEFKNYEKIFHPHPKCKKIFITTIPSNSTVNIFHNFFDLIYHTFVVIDNNLKIMNKEYDKDLIKIYDRNEQFSDYKSLYIKYGWDIFLINKFIINIINPPKLTTIVDKFSRNNPLISFISVPPSKEDVDTYLKILDYRKEVSRY